MITGAVSVILGFFIGVVAGFVLGYTVKGFN